MELAGKNGEPLREKHIMYSALQISEKGTGADYDN
jgi:hypothetical protein